MCFVVMVRIAKQQARASPVDNDKNIAVNPNGAVGPRKATEGFVDAMRKLQINQQESQISHEIGNSAQANQIDATLKSVN